ncbi:MAG: hypothetical protein ACTHKO_00135 [Sphingopyxis terrae]
MINNPVGDAILNAKAASASGAPVHDARSEVKAVSLSRNPGELSRRQPIFA